MGPNGVSTSFTWALVSSGLRKCRSLKVTPRPLTGPRQVLPCPCTNLVTVCAGPSGTLVSVPVAEVARVSRRGCGLWPGLAVLLPQWTLPLPPGLGASSVLTLGPRLL